MRRFIQNYLVAVEGDKYVVGQANGDGFTTIAKDEVEGLGKIARSAGVKVGWGRFEDGMEVIYIYDSKDHNFGYSINLHVPYFSEWGYAPF